MSLLPLNSAAARRGGGSTPTCAIVVGDTILVSCNHDTPSKRSCDFALRTFPTDAEFASDSATAFRSPDMQPSRSGICLLSDESWMSCDIGENGPATWESNAS